jgi:hypothetical protein
MRCLMPLSCSTHASNCAFDLFLLCAGRALLGRHAFSPRTKGLARGLARVAIRRMTQQKLSAPGHVVHQAYLLQCLRLVHEFGALRVLTIAYAMFPVRTQKAASSAAKRVVGKALQEGYLACHIEADSRRYYALTLLGARVLHSFDDRYRVRSTTNALTFHRHEHREWCNVVALASRHHGLSSRSEAQIVGAAHTEIVHSFGHVPDALTYYVDDGEQRAMWHEIELSRRSTSGTKKLRHLVRTLIERRYLTHNNQEHNINLVMHCSTAKIERENRKVIGEALAECKADVQELDEDAEAAYVARVGAGQARRWFLVYINQLPEAVEGAWASSLPWPGCPGVVSSDIDVFLRHRDSEPAQGAAE